MLSRSADCDSSSVMSPMTGSGVHDVDVGELSSVADMCDCAICVIETMLVQKMTAQR